MKGKYLLACALAFAWVPEGLAQTWIEVNAPSRDWAQPAYSTNGDIIVAAAHGEGIYISTNSGLDWTLTSAPKTNWTSVACSADANEIVATVSKDQSIFPYNNVPGQIYISTDAGLTWKTASAPIENWSSVACSSDGTTLLAAGGDGFVPGLLYTSTNSGATWSTAANIEDRWAHVTMSPDARRLFARNDVGGVFLSTNSGLNWDRTSVSGNFAIADDGQRVLVAGSQIYVSTDSGMTGTYLDETNGITFIGASEDGLALVGAKGSGSLFTSANGGTNLTLVPNSGGNWQTVVASPNGAWRIAMEGFGRTWISYAPDSPPFFVVQPIASTNVYEATAVTLKATALGSAPMVFQWQFNGTNLLDNERVTGSATSELTITNLQVSDTGIYTLVATNGFGATNSESTVLTVNADVERPSLQITDPTAREKWAAAAFQAGGTTSDNSQVAGVWFQLNSGPWTLAATLNGWRSWFANFSPTNGANTLSVYAIDQVGNISLTNTVSFTVVRQSPMFVRTSGQGRVTPVYDEQLLNVGAHYKITAKPAKGFIFTGWTGDIQSDTATLSFTMQDDLSVEADFVPNPFLGTRGRYEGSIFGRFPIPVLGNNFLKMNVEKNGAFAARIDLNKQTYHFSGKFSATGNAIIAVSKKGLTPFNVNLQLDLSGGNTLRAELSGFDLIGECEAVKK